MIYQNMGGKRATESKNKRLRKLLNSVSLHEAIEKIKNRIKYSVILVYNKSRLSKTISPFIMDI